MVPQSRLSRLQRQLTMKFQPRQHFNSLVFLSLFVITALFLLWPTSSAPGAHTLHFVSLGDHGRGSLEQLSVAREMAFVVEQYEAQFVVTLGDNFYAKGIKGLNDLSIKTKFEDIYADNSLQIPWYVSLGDHDHRGSVAAQIAYSDVSKRWNLPSPYYVKHFSLSHGGILDLFVTDSVGLEGFILRADEERRFAEDYNSTYAGAEAGQRQIQWLEKVLKESSATWRIVVGHRPLQSCADRSRFPVEERLRDLLLPLFVKYKVHVYMHGHDHIGQHLEEMGVVYVGNGVGGFGTHPAHGNNLTVWFDSHYQGFILHSVTPSKLEFTYMDERGETLHKIQLTQDFSEM